MRKTTRGLVVGGALLAMVLASSGAQAHEEHGRNPFGKRGERLLADQVHLPATQKNVELVGKVKLSNIQRGRVSDVGVHGRYAYLGDFSGSRCDGSGVWIVDISDPKRPREVKYLRTGDGGYVGEGVQAIRLNTPKYTGDVLVLSNEPCVENGLGGGTLVDVTHPDRATPVLSSFGDYDPPPGDARAAHEPRVAHPSHSVFMWTDGPRAYAVLVDNAEAGADIFDISDPRRPVRIAEYQLPTQFPRILQDPDSLSEAFPFLFFHDVVVKKIRGRQIMLVSNWDAGYVKLDVTDPRRPKYLADSDFAAVDPELEHQYGTRQKPEGNAHEAEFTLDNRYIVSADEDFSPNQAIVTFGKDRQATGTLGVVLEGDYRPVPVYAGDACPGRTQVPPAPRDGKRYVAVVEDGTCDVQAKHDSVAAAGGYTAIVLVPGLACSSGSLDLTADRIPVVYLYDRALGLAPFDYDTSKETFPNCEAGEPTKLADLRVGAAGKTIRLQGFFDGWGYVHLYANNDGKLRELDTWAIPEAMKPRYASGYGALSVHEAAASHRRAELVYLSYYGGGLRVASVAGGRIREVGSFIDDRGNDFWGVQVFQHRGQELVAASDRSYGLYLFRYTGR